MKFALIFAIALCSVAASEALLQINCNLPGGLHRRISDGVNVRKVIRDARGKIIAISGGGTGGCNTPKPVVTPEDDIQFPKGVIIKNIVRDENGKIISYEGVGVPTYHTPEPVVPKCPFIQVRPTLPILPLLKKIDLQKNIKLLDQQIKSLIEIKDKKIALLQTCSN